VRRRLLRPTTPQLYTRRVPAHLARIAAVTCRLLPAPHRQQSTRQAQSTYRPAAVWRRARRAHRYPLTRQRLPAPHRQRSTPRAQSRYRPAAVVWRRARRAHRHPLTRQLLPAPHRQQSTPRAQSRYRPAAAVWRRAPRAHRYSPTRQAQAQRLSAAVAAAVPWKALQACTRLSLNPRPPAKSPRVAAPAHLPQARRRPVAMSKARLLHLPPRSQARLRSTHIRSHAQASLSDRSVTAAGVPASTPLAQS